MAGEDTLTVSSGEVDTTTIISSNGKLVNGNGLHNQKHNNNSSIIPNAKELEIAAAENSKLEKINEKWSNFQTNFEDEDTSCGWGPIRPHWLQRFATKQMFLVIFCVTWVSTKYYNLFTFSN
jgi:hypothetical protein